MLILVPSPLSQTTPKLPVLHEDLPQIRECKTWIVETAKPARAALQVLEMPVPIRDLEILELKNLEKQALASLLERAKAGESIALMSDAGCPAIADPGADVVAMAHQMSCPVRALVGPSSILLALMSSGLNGQNFHFHGYLPVEAPQRQKRIQYLETESARNNTTQIAIETPFRNQKLLDALLQSLKPTTRLCVAVDLTGNDEWVHSDTVGNWKKKEQALPKAPALFLWLA